MLLRLNVLLVAALAAVAAGHAAVVPALRIWEWALLPALGVLTTVGVLWMGRYVRRDPRWVNLPDKDRLLRLPPERQGLVLARVDEMMQGVNLASLGVFLLVQQLVRAETLGLPEQGWLVAVLVASVGTTPLVLAVFLPRISGEIKRQERADGATRTPPPAPRPHPNFP